MVFLVLESYRIRDEHRAAYLEAAPAIAKNGMDLGCVWFEIYEDDDHPNEFTEMMAFDSWTHYERLRQVPQTREMAALTREMDTWIDGGLAAIRSTHLKSAID
ncbi:MAG: MFS transporter [Deltaproteobacteria bacterium]|nr:MFS transporter [Deltaproteobacteria bacterium]